MTRVRQLAFPFPQRATYDAADFMATVANAEALTWLARPLDWPDLRLAVHGPEGCGKTHLLHVFAGRQGATLLPGEAVRHLIDLPSAGLAVDDADAAPEAEALLHLLNAAAEARLPVLLAGRAPPAHWPIALPDLASRLRATVSVGLGQPDDEFLKTLFARMLAKRQLRVEADVQIYLLDRLPRHGAALREAACCLDRLSLATGRAVGRGLAQEVLARLGGDEAEGSAPRLPEAAGLL